MLLLATALIVVAGCTGATTSSGPTTSPCGPDAQARCSSVTVPADWSSPDGASIRLRVMVFRGAAARPDQDPLFYLAGFGGAATGDDDVAWATSTFADLNQTHDLVLVDQRGTGGSAPQTCPASVEDRTLAADAIRAVVRDCLAGADRDPRHDTTPAAVRDLDRVRAVLGYDRISLYGISYGVTAALAYLQRYGDHVRTAVLDSGSLLDVPLWQRVPTSAEGAFDQLAQRCSAAPECGGSFDPATDLASVSQDLAAQPARVPVGGTTATVDLPGFLDAVIDDYLATPSTAVLLPADLHDLAGGRWATVLQRRGADQRTVEDGATPVPMQKITITCSDAWADLSPSRVARQPATSFSPAMVAKAAWWDALCSAWLHDPGASGPVRTSVPVVFLNGTADPADPPANVAAAADTMPNALLVPVPGGAHGVLTGCLVPLVTDFVETGATRDEAAWTACARSREAQYPPFPRPGA
jgi:pimeloyl-ACP methyl ester carboxylesterase